MKKNIATLLGIALVVALIATGVFYGLVAGKIRAASADQPKVAVVVAARALRRGATLDKKDLKMVMYDAGAAPADAVSSPERLQGVTIVEPIAENQPVLESVLISPRTIPSGMRVVSVRASDSSGVVALLRPGHRVDVQVVASMPDKGAGLRTLVQNIAVLSVGAPDNGRPVVNLLVSPAEADLIGLADSTAKVRLVLRNPGDSGRMDAAVTSSGKLYENASFLEMAARP